MPVEIPKKTPFAGLWVGLSDEEELCIKYSTADDIQSRLVKIMREAKETASDLMLPRIEREGLEQGLTVPQQISSSSH